MKKLIKKLRRAWKWYIKGDYHCDKCPYCWSEWTYEGDGDFGCYIRGDLWDTCRLIPPIRFLIGWPRMKRTQYWEAHRYDGMGEWYEQLVEREEAYAESVKILLKETELYKRDCEGKLMPICKADILEIFSFGSGPFGEAFRYYEDHAHPIVGEPPLKQQLSLWRVKRSESLTMATTLSELLPEAHLCLATVRSTNGSISTS